MDKIIYQSIILKYSPRRAFEQFTANKNLERWLTQVADVEPKVGGKYELFWNPDDKENDSTIGCKVLVISKDRVLCFEWKGPQLFKHFMNNTKPLTCVTVFFNPCSKGTEVHLLHTGWGDSPEWEDAREWFDKAWKNALSRLEKK